MAWILALALTLGTMAGDREAGSPLDRQVPGPTPTSRDLEGRECQDDEATGKRSLFCALQKACIDAIGRYDHRRVALQEVRFAVVDATRGHQFEHRLRDFNNLPTTRLADIKAVLQVATDRVQSRLKAK
jgi:hypothetical protein